MNNRKFVRKLYFDNYAKAHEVFGDLLNDIFYDVSEYKDAYNLRINVRAKVNGYNTLGSYFKNSFNHGVFYIWSNKVITNCGFIVYFYDDRFEVCETDFHDNKFLSLMKPKYQKRYIAEMYKMFGEPYKKHYQELLQEKRKKLEEETQFLK